VVVNRAVILVTPELLREWIPLPVTTSILGSIKSHGEIAIVVEDPVLPPVKDGDEIPVVTPTFRKNVPVEFVSWGINPRTPEDAEDDLRSLREEASGE
jgi:hypothetical protein